MHSVIRIIIRVSLSQRSYQNNYTILSPNWWWHQTRFMDEIYTFCFGAICIYDHKKPL